MKRWMARHWGPKGKTIILKGRLKASRKSWLWRQLFLWWWTLLTTLLFSLTRNAQVAPCYWLLHACRKTSEHVVLKKDDIANMFLNLKPLLIVYLFLLRVKPHWPPDCTTSWLALFGLMKEKTLLSNTSCTCTGCIEKNSELVSVIPLGETSSWSKGFGKVGYLHPSPGSSKRWRSNASYSPDSESQIISVFIGNFAKTGLLDLRSVKLMNHVTDDKVPKSNLTLNVGLNANKTGFWSIAFRFMSFLFALNFPLNWNYDNHIKGQKLVWYMKHCFQIQELSLCLEPAGRYPSPPLPVKSVGFWCSWKVWWCGCT